jgi:hypothetical protein
MKQQGIGLSRNETAGQSTSKHADVFISSCIPRPCMPHTKQPSQLPLLNWNAWYHLCSDSAVLTTESQHK